ncbi:hypothetical protein TorRG33x02_222840 [Trema orientale]|uniref:Uncharacterized protein n=1 Tax=Trema orientale TaxID=63057 RepID=A0A2P5E8U5_TREOI|nr:hypothetical protein TorRG33x02_222840 [Trema orientale]
MGCCLSSNKPPQKEPNLPNVPINHHHIRRSTPSPEMEPTLVSKTHVTTPHPPVVEEETVKEVLSEIPVSKSPTPETFSEKITHFPVKQLEPEVKEVSEASQVTEACEVSESFSYLSTTTTTTTVTEVREEEEAISKRKREVGPRVTNGSSGITRRKRPNCGGELAGRRGRGPISPASRPERSAEKRNRVESKSVRGRESGQVRTTQRSGGYTGITRRDIGEVSSRRSRSPAPRNTCGASRGGLGRNTSKGTGRAGGRSLGGDGESQSKSQSNGGKEEDQNDVGSSQLGNNESLENPLVALECFIFV